MNIKKFISYGYCLGMLYGSAFAGDPESVPDRYISLALQGDLNQAESLFSSINPHTASISDIELASRFQARFIKQSENLSPATGDAFTDAVVSSYREYWIGTLMGNMSGQEGEEFLRASLRRDTIRLSPAEHTSRASDIFEFVGEIFDGKGVHYLGTSDPP